MFLPREKKIIEMLYRAEEPYTIGQIAEELALSDKTISNTIKQVRPILSDFGIQICSKPSVGTWLDFDEGGRVNLKKMLEDSYTQGDDRKIRIAKCLLSNRHHQSLETIAEKTFYSKTTVHREIKELQIFFEKYGLQLEQKNRYGIRVVGDEAKIRIVEAELIKLVLQDGTENKLLGALESYFSKTLLSQIIALIFEMEDQHDVELPYLSKQGLLIHLAITIDRTKREHHVRLTEDELTSLRKQEEWPLAEFLLDEMNQLLGISLDENECGYITIHLMSASLIAKECDNPEKVRTIASIDQKMSQQLGEILRGLDRQYGLPFSENQEFRTRLFLHIKPMVNRLSNQISVYNPFTQDIKKFHSYAYEIAVDLSKRIAAVFQLNFDENEIAYIAMHIGCFLEKYQKPMDQIKVVLVCASGMGTSQFLKARIENRFAEIEIVDVISSFSIKKLSQAGAPDYDFILTTIPLDLENDQIIQISPMLNEGDLAKLMVLNSRKNELYSLNQGNVLSEFLFPEISLFNQRLETYDEVIRHLGGKMVSYGYTDENFVASVLEREALSATAIGSMIAIPHAFEGHILRQAIGILHLEKPISWNNSENQVKLVFLLGIDQNSSKKFEAIFTEIVSLMDDPKNLNEMLNAGSFEAFEEIIQKGERYGFM